jgi:putative inorganic carbon (HCO3(-)) transporter
LVVILPVLLLPEVLPPWVVCAALGLVPIYFILHLLVRHGTVPTPFNLPILLLLLSVPLSLYASVDMRVSLPKLAGILLGLCLFYALVSSRTSTSGPAFAAFLLLLCGLAISLLALVATDWNTAKLPLLGNLAQYLPRLIASIPHPLKQGGGINANEVGGALALILPLNLVLAWRSVRDPQGLQVPAGPRIPHIWVSGFLVISLLVTLFTLALSQSRSAFLGLAFGVVLLAAVRYRLVRLAVLILLLVGGVAAYAIGVEQVGHRLLDPGESTAAVGTLDLAARVEVWQRAVYILQDFPFTGIGLNTFSIVVGVMYPYFLISPGTFVAHAHNILLQVGVDLGIPGMVSYVALLAVFFGCAIIAYRRAQDPAWRAVIAGLAAGMVAHQVYGLTDAITLGAKPGFLFWIILALVAMLHARTEARAKHSSRVIAPHAGADANASPLRAPDSRGE